MTIVRRAAIFALAFALLVNAGSSSLAVQPDEVLQDSALEARARLISKDLRCLVCQNQSIDDSDASLAKDLRILVRERLVAGDSNSEVVDYVVSRYGEFVLLKPRISAQNIVLWGAPFLLLLLGGGLLLHSVRKPRSINAKSSLSSDEKETLAKILGDRDRDTG